MATETQELDINALLYVDAKDEDATAPAINMFFKFPILNPF